MTRSKSKDDYSREFESGHHMLAYDVDGNDILKDAISQSQIMGHNHTIEAIDSEQKVND